MNHPDELLKKWEVETIRLFIDDEMAPYRFALTKFLNENFYLFMKETKQYVDRIKKSEERLNSLDKRMEEKLNRASHNNNELVKLHNYHLRRFEELKEKIQASVLGDFQGLKNEVESLKDEIAELKLKENNITPVRATIRSPNLNQFSFSHCLFIISFNSDTKSIPKVRVLSGVQNPKPPKRRAFWWFMGYLGKICSSDRILTLSNCRY